MGGPTFFFLFLENESNRFFNRHDEKKRFLTPPVANALFREKKIPQKNSRQHATGQGSQIFYVFRKIFFFSKIQDNSPPVLTGSSRFLGHTSQPPFPPQRGCFQSGLFSTFSCSSFLLSWLFFQKLLVFIGPLAVGKSARAQKKKPPGFRFFFQTSSFDAPISAPASLSHGTQ